MKDAYSFDRDEAGVDVSFQKHARAYERIFERCGLEAVAVQAESGMMGGSESIDYLAPSGSGENTLVTCERGDYAADLEIAHGVPRAPTFPERLDKPAEVATPGITTIEELAGFLGIDPAATSKAMPVTKDDGTVVLALIRGDDRLEEAKLAAALGSASRPSTEEEIRAAFGADPGSLGPVGFAGEIVADEALREGQFVAGANRTGWHLRGVEHGRDFTARFADIRQPVEGDSCPVCGGRLGFQTAIEVGHIFKLGTTYSAPFGATFLDENGDEHPVLMGCYGIGPGRIIAATVEQHHDEHGIVWPRVDRSIRCPCARTPRRRGGGARAGRRGRRASVERRPRRPSGRPGPASGREIRRCRSARRADPGHGGQEDAGRWSGRCAHPVDRRRRSHSA